jgi:chromosome segregation ATPase
MDMKKVSDEEIRLAWHDLCERKGEPPTVEEVLEVTGGKTLRVNAICGECHEQYQRSKRSGNDPLRKQLVLYTDRMVSLAVEAADERVRTLQAAHASAIDALTRGQESLKSQLGVAQATLGELQEENKKLKFELQGATTQAAADARNQAALEAKVRELLHEVAQRSSALAEKEAENGRLRAELQRKAEDRLTRAEDLFQTTAAELRQEISRRQKRGPR